MSLNASSQNAARAVDTRLRALRRLSIPQSPESQVEELQAAYSSAIAEVQGWVAECESLLLACESEREKTATLAEQLECARADAEQIIEALASAYTANARTAADGERAAKELAAAVKELSELRGIHAELRSHDHELLKRCGDLTSRVASKSALLEERTDELTRVLQERDAESALLQERTVELERARAERDALKKQSAELSEALKDVRSSNMHLSDELAETTDRFLAFVNEAHVERRTEVQTLSQLIDEAQQGRAWGLKRLLRKLWRK